MYACVCLFIAMKPGNEAPGGYFPTLHPCRDIAVRSEGYQARDLVSLTHRAVAHSCIHSICPLPQEDELGWTPPATRKKLPAIASLISESQSSDRNRKVSDAPTVIPIFPVVASSGDYHVTRSDFLEAMRGFVPASLRGLPLHSAGELDFSRVGGMERVKETLRETMLWPSKVC